MTDSARIELGQLGGDTITIIGIRLTEVRDHLVLDHVADAYHGAGDDVGDARLLAFIEQTIEVAGQKTRITDVIAGTKVGVSHVDQDKIQQDEEKAKEKVQDLGNKVKEKVSTPASSAREEGSKP